MSPFHVIILAAGQGKRMKSSLPKVLHKVGGRALIEHAVNLATKASREPLTIVVPRDHGAIQTALAKGDFSSQTFTFAVQHKQQGTGDALKSGVNAISAKTGQVLVLNADMPFVSPQSIKRLIQQHQKQQAVVSLLTASVRNPHGLGRIVRSRDGRVTGIIEEKDATETEKAIREINMGIYVFDLKFLHENLSRLQPNNKQQEYYITDFVRFAAGAGLPVVATVVADEWEALGVNSQQHLYILNHLFYQRQRDLFMKEGVCFLGSEIYIDVGIKIGAGTIIESPCYLKGKTHIGENCLIESGCTLKSSKIEEGVIIKAHSYVDDARVGSCCQVGPFAHLRPQTKLLRGAKVGNFVEIKKTVMGEGSKANHLTYLGDAVIGKNVNVGAGTITCNYDGYHKYKTVLEDGVFIGSDTQLVAPVKVGRGAYVGAGTTVTDDVAAESLVISRVRQKEIPHWARMHRQKNKSKG